MEFYLKSFQIHVLRFPPTSTVGTVGAVGTAGPDLRFFRGRTLRPPWTLFRPMKTQNSTIILQIYQNQLSEESKTYKHLENGI